MMPLLGVGNVPSEVVRDMGRILIPEIKKDLETNLVDEVVSSRSGNDGWMLTLVRKGYKHNYIHLLNQLRDVEQGEVIPIYLYGSMPAIKTEVKYKVMGLDWDKQKEGEIQEEIAEINIGRDDNLIEMKPKDNDLMSIAEIQEDQQEEKTSQMLDGQVLIKISSFMVMYPADTIKENVMKIKDLLEMFTDTVWGVDWDLLENGKGSNRIEKVQLTSITGESCKVELSKGNKHTLGDIHVYQ